MCSPRVASIALLIGGPLIVTVALTGPTPATAAPGSAPPVASAARSAAGTNRSAHGCRQLGGAVNELTGRRENTGTLIAVKIDNMSRVAWPQVGLDQADMDVVEEIEAGYTRHVALFASHYPKRVGPVRSARETDLELLPSFGRPGLVFSGAAKVVRQQIAVASVKPMWEYHPKAGFARDRIRAKEKGHTHSLFANTAVLERTARSRGATRVTPQTTCFGVLPADGSHVVALGVSWPRQGVVATWSPRVRRWAFGYRYGRDAASPQVPVLVEGHHHVMADNVVVLITKRSYVRIAYEGKANQVTVPHTSTLGSGPAIVLRDGRAFPARWSRPALSAPITLRTTRGAKMPLHIGTTWTLLVTQGRKLTLRPTGKAARAALIPANSTMPSSLVPLLRAPQPR